MILDPDPELVAAVDLLASPRLVDSTRFDHEADLRLGDPVTVRGVAIAQINVEHPGLIAGRHLDRGAQTPAGFAALDRRDLYVSAPIHLPPRSRPHHRGMVGRLDLSRACGEKS